MARRLLIGLLTIAAAGATGAAAEEKSARPLLPAGGLWQSIPHAGAASERPARTAFNTAAHEQTHTSPARIVAKPMTAQAKTQAPPRNPVPAATPPAKPPADTAAARTRELSRRLAILSPGAALDEPIADRENPAWRRRAPNQPGADGREFSVPFDDTGKAGFIARGYHQDPAWNNPTGNLGATFGLRQKF